MSLDKTYPNSYWEKYSKNQCHWRFHHWKRSDHVHYIAILHPFSEHLDNIEKITSSKNYVLYLHGMGNDTHYLTYYLADSLFKQDIGFIGCDLEGHGSKSLGNWSGECSMVFIAQIRQFLGLLNINYIHIVGHSLGSVISACGFSDETNFYHHKKSADNLSKLKKIDHLDDGQGSYSQVRSMILLSVPWKFSAKIINAVPELSVFVTIGFWRYLLRYGLKSILPTVGQINRKNHPIRVASSENIKPQKKITAWIASQDIISSINNIGCCTLIIQGTRDKVISTLNPSVIKNHRVKVVKFRVTHLGILIDQGVVQRIIAHVKKHSFD